MTTLRRTSGFAAVAIAAISIAAGCGSSSPKSTSGPTTTAPPSSSAPGYGPASPTTPAPQSAGALKFGTPKFPNALTDSSGRAIYLFEADKSTTSTCNGECAAAWPPVLTTGTPSITGGDMAKLGTTTRTDGTKQITYNGHPLYYFAGDTSPGTTNGQGSTAFGAGWYLIGPDGNKINNS